LTESGVVHLQIKQSLVKTTFKLQVITGKKFDNYVYKLIFGAVYGQRNHIKDPLHKWLPIKNSFVSIKISPTNLVFELKIHKNFYSQKRLVGLI